MGSVKKPVLSLSEICRLYVEEGQPVGMLSLRARVPTYRIKEILTDAGVPVRGAREALQIVLDQRAAKARRSA